MSLKIDSPEEFYKSIPKNISDNIKWRMRLHSLLEKNKELQQIYLQLIKSDFKIAFNSMLWTKNPRKPADESNLPFILRPKQEEMVDKLVASIHNQNDFGINKSRDEGATECVTKVFALFTILEKDRYFVVGSRNKDLVDTQGDPYTLFAKIDQVFETIPPWLKANIGNINRKDMQLVVPVTGSVIRGETTNENFSAGRRATAVLLDEFGRVDPRSAKSIEGSVHDVSGCVVYASTHWFGEQHPFNLALRKKSTQVVNLLWYKNPEKSAGLYTSPDYDLIEIIDKDYYLNKYPEIFNSDGPWSFKLSELEKSLMAKGYSGSSPKFVADGCETLPKGADLRSPWHDSEEETRKGNLRDFISNVWGSPVGSQDSVFNPIVLDRLESQARPPSFLGEVNYTRTADGEITGYSFGSGGKSRLRWWGEVKNGKPLVEHNYVIGCDISLGTGNSNSVAAIMDVNTHEIVGTWVCPNTPYEQFADITTALGLLLNEAYIVFENNGGHGVNFGRRLKSNKYRRIYTQRAEDKKTKTVQNSWGWHSDPNKKSDLLGELGIALSEGLKNKPSYISCKLYDEDIIQELRGYVFYENGDIGAAEEQDLTSGARKRHGDRVIGVGLCVLGSKYQHKKKKVVVEKVNIDSFEYRRQLDREEQDKNSRTKRRFLY